MSKFTDISFVYDMPILKVAKHFDVEEVFEPRMTAPQFSQKYCGIMQFGVTFYANQANYRQAVENAERVVYSQLNRKAIIELEKLKGIAYKYVDSELEAAINNVMYLVDGGK